MLQSMTLPILLAAYGLMAFVTLRYFLLLLQSAEWEIREYFHILSGENLRWLPLIFCLVPAAALLMGYGGFAYALCAVYALVILAGYLPRPGRTPVIRSGTARRLLVSGIGIWLFLAVVTAALCGLRSTGMAAVLALTFIGQPLAVPLLYLTDRPAARHISRRFVRGSEDILSLQRDLCIIAVMGSGNAQVLMSALWEILSSRYRCETASRTVRTQLDAAQIIRDRADAQLEYLLCRLDADGEEEMKEILETLHPAISIQASVDYYALLENAGEKMNYGIRFVNGDDAALRKFIGTERVLTYGMNEDNDCRCTQLSVSGEGTDFSVSGAWQQTMVLHTRLLGRDQITALAGAVCVSCALGVTEEYIHRSIAGISAAPHRMELRSLRPGEKSPQTMEPWFETLVPGPLQERQAGTVVIDDSANEEVLAAETALDTLEGFRGRKILVTGGFMRQGAIQEEANRRFGRKAAGICDRIVLTGAEIAYGLKGGIQEAGFRPECLSEAADVREAVALIGGWDTEEEKVVLIEGVDQRA